MADGGAPAPQPPPAAPVLPVVPPASPVQPHNQLSHCRTSCSTSSTKLYVTIELVSL